MYPPLSSGNEETRPFTYEDSRLNRLPEPIYAEFEALSRNLLSTATSFLLAEADDSGFASAGGYYIARIFKLQAQSHAE